LGWYAERYASVEVNATFYRLPEPSTFRGWARAVPEGFTFAVKASRYITHIRRLRDVRASVRLLQERASAATRPGGPRTSPGCSMEQASPWCGRIGRGSARRFP